MYVAATSVSFCKFLSNECPSSSLSGSSYTIDKLVPQMTYVFRFKAQSKAGDGEWGGEKVSKQGFRHALHASIPVLSILLMQTFTSIFILVFLLLLDSKATLS